MTTADRIQSTIDMHDAEIAYCQANPTDDNMRRVGELMQAIAQLTQTLEEVQNEQTI